MLSDRVIRFHRTLRFLTAFAREVIFLLYFYTDNLSTQLLSTRIGCHTFGECVDHKAYADDLILFASLIKALQTFIDICYRIVKQKPIAWLSGHVQCVLPSVALGIYDLLEICCWSGLSWEFYKLQPKNDSDVYKQVKKLNKIGNVLIREFASCSEKWNVNSSEHIAQHYNVLHCSVHLF